LADCSDVTNVAAYASVIVSSVNQSTDSEILTSHGLTFRDLETGAFYLQTQLLQVLCQLVVLQLLCKYIYIYICKVLHSSRFWISRRRASAKKVRVFFVSIICTVVINTRTSSCIIDYKIVKGICHCFDDVGWKSPQGSKTDVCVLW